MVYKLVEIEGKPTFKLSESMEKSTLPGRKELLRVFTDGGMALCDIVRIVGEDVKVVFPANKLD